MIKLEHYTLNQVPDYCLYSRISSFMFGEPIFGIIYINSNTKFGHWFENYYKNLAKYSEPLKIKSMKTRCCGHMPSNLIHVQLKKQRKVQGLKDGKGYKEFFQWMREKTRDYSSIWFSNYRYLEQFYDGTLWSNSKNMH